VFAGVVAVFPRQFSQAEEREAESIQTIAQSTLLSACSEVAISALVRMVEGPYRFVCDRGRGGCFGAMA